MMPNDGAGGSRPTERILLALAAVVVLALVALAVVALTRSSGEDTTATEDATTSSGPTTVSAPGQSTTTAVEVDAGAAELTPWLGTYSWSESISGAEVLVMQHRLQLDAVDAETTQIVGRLRQQGAGTDIDVAVVAGIEGAKLVVSVDAAATDQADYQPGEVLLRLDGTPEQPTTELVGLINLLIELPRSGAYFLPGAGGQSSEEGLEATTTTVPELNLALALASDGLTVVTVDSGSTSHLLFGATEESVRIVLDQIYGDPVVGTVSPECPNEADATAVWGGEIAIDFRDGAFIAWDLAPGSTLTTMSGAGLGSTRAEISEAVSIEVYESGLGTEFLIGSDSESGIRGLLENAEPGAKVLDLWAGEVCIFS